MARLFKTGWLYKTRYTKDLYPTKQGAADGAFWAKTMGVLEQGAVFLVLDTLDANVIQILTADQQKIGWLRIIGEHPNRLYELLRK